MFSLLFRKPDVYRFTNTAKPMNGALANVAAVDASVVTDLLAVTIGITAHGFSAGSNIYFQGTTNYDGVRLIHAVATNTVDVLAKYVAENPNGQSYFCGLTYPTPFVFLGFELHLSAAATTDEDFEVSIDSNLASTHDTKIYDHSMAGVQDIIYTPTKQVICGANDVIKCTWANTDARNWGLDLFAAALV